MNKGLVMLGLLMSLAATAGAQNSAQQGGKAQQTPPSKQAAAQPEGTQIYGYQLMTAEERTEYRAKMRSLDTLEEREAFRLEHHRKMQERAKERGVTLPSEPPSGGMGAGKRQGMGPGAGQGTGPGGGQGMGPGGGQKRGQQGNPPPR